MIKRKSGGSGSVYRCVPVKSQGPCTGSRNGLGEAKFVMVPCKQCGEWRCKSHCRCARNNKLEGRSRGRDGATTGGSTSSVMSPSASSSPSSSAAPKSKVCLPTACQAVANPADVHSLKVLDGEGHLNSLVRDLPSASAVDMAMYTYDDSRLHAALLKHLAGGGTFKLCLDKQYLAERPTTHGLLRALAKAGAEIYTQSGDGKYGSMHFKVTLLRCAGGKVIAYHGSANATKQSRSNWESVLRLTGSGNTRDIVKQLKECFATATQAKELGR